VRFLLFFLLLAPLLHVQNKAAPAALARTMPATGTTPLSLEQIYFYDYYFPFNPTAGTAAGFHQYDTQLEDYSRASIDRQIAMLKKFKSEHRPYPLGPDDGGAKVAEWIDYNLILNNVNSTLLTLEQIRPWEKNPDVYSSGITNSIFVIMARTFAPPDERLKSVIAREKQMPSVFQVARQNLKNPPPIYVNVALEQIPGIIGFFQKDVPEAFKDVKDQALLAEFRASNQKVMDELKAYGQWIEK